MAKSRAVPKEKLTKKEKQFSEFVRGEAGKYLATVLDESRRLKIDKVVAIGEVLRIGAEMKSSLLQKLIDLFVEPEKPCPTKPVKKKP